MLYIETTTLFDLNTINTQNLKSKIEKSKKNFTLDIVKIEDFLKIIQMEAKIVNKLDFDVIFSLNVSNANRPVLTITIEPQKKLLPHLSYTRKKLILEVELEDFNKLPIDTLINKSFSKYASKKFPEGQPIVCNKESTYLLKVLSKIDSMFNTGNEFYTAIYNKGLYIETIKLKCNTFDITYTTSSLILESIAKKHTNTNIKRSLVAISVEFETWKSMEDTIIKIEVYNQVINLTYLEFVTASNEHIETAIVSILRLKSIEINNLEDLKNQLLIHEMINQ